MMRAFLYGDVNVRNLIVYCAISTLMFQTLLCAVEVQETYHASSLRSERICEPETMNRISRDVVQVSEYQSKLVVQSATAFSAPDNQSEKEKRSWIKKHPVVFGTLVGFGIGFTVGLASGGGSDVSAAGMGLYFGAIGAGAGALIVSVAAK